MEENKILNAIDGLAKRMDNMELNQTLMLVGLKELKENQDTMKDEIKKLSSQQVELSNQLKNEINKAYYTIGDAMNKTNNFLYHELKSFMSKNEEEHNEFRERLKIVN